MIAGASEIASETSDSKLVMPVTHSIEEIMQLVSFELCSLSLIAYNFWNVHMNII